MSTSCRDGGKGTDISENSAIDGLGNEASDAKSGSEEDDGRVDELFDISDKVLIGHGHGHENGGTIPRTTTTTTTCSSSAPLLDLHDGIEAEREHIHGSAAGSYCVHHPIGPAREIITNGPYCNSLGQRGRHDERPGEERKRLQNIRHTEAKDDAPIRRSQSTVGPYDGDRYEGGCHEGYRGGRYLHANELIMIHDVVG